MPFADIHCPYCGEPIGLVLDTSAGDQHYIEDCQVCCRPIVVMLQVDIDGQAQVSVRREDEA